MPIKLLMTVFVSGLLIFAAFSAAFSASTFGQDTTTSQADAPATAEAVLVVDAGPCAAEFVVRDESGKGLYDAKITMKAQYGFMGLRRLDLNVGTNSEGRARIEGLPEKTRSAVDFKVSQGGREKIVAYDPVGHCKAQHEVTLAGAAENKAK